jgi:exoribonuclease-2
LRRYQDLTVHQQLRAFIQGETVLDETQLSEKLMSQDQRSGSVRRAERFSNQHWKLVFLQRNPQWQGQAVIVFKDERKATIIIPELAMETKIRTRENFQLDDTISVRVTGVDLPEQTAYFQCL